MSAELPVLTAKVVMWVLVGAYLSLLAALGALTVFAFSVWWRSR